MAVQRTPCLWLVGLPILALACSSSPTPSDGGVDAGADAGIIDAGTPDGGNDGGLTSSLMLFSISPTQGMAGGTFTIQGVGIAQGAQVFFGTAPVADAMTSSDGTAVSGTVPAQGGSSATVSVTVTNTPGISATLNNAFTYASNQVTWCKLSAPTMVEVLAGSATPMLSAEVMPAMFADTTMPAGEVGYGDPAMSPDQWTWSPATAASMTDGPNGVYQATLTPAMAGSYAFAFRFTGDGTKYLYCDTNGTDKDPASGFQVSAAGQLTVDAVPTITGFSPSSGSSGDTVTLTGTGFTSGIQVTFGSAMATVVTVAMDGTSATVTVPDGSGSVPVSVLLDGQSIQAPGMFTYASQTVNWCQIYAPTSLTSFLGDATPALNAEVWINGVTPNDGTGITGQIGLGMTGTDPSTWNWSAATWLGHDTNNDVYTAMLTPNTAGNWLFAFRFKVNSGAYTYCDTTGNSSTLDASKAGTITVLQKPTITDVQPSHAAAGDSVTVIGTNLNGNTTIDFGSNAAMITGVANDGTSVTVTVPAGSGMVSVSAAEDGYTTTWASQFTYDLPVGFCQLDAPTSATIVAGQATPTLSGEVYVAGLTDMTNMGAGITAEVGYGPAASTADTWTWTSASFAGTTGSMNHNDLFTGTLTPAAAGTYAYGFRFSAGGAYVYCDTAGKAQGTSLSAPGTLTVLPAPAITDVQPTHAQVGDSVTITGTGFAQGTTFMFGPNQATVSMLTATSAIVTVPFGSGTVNVTAALMGVSASWSGQFTYDTQTKPVITSLSPSIMSVNGGVLTINGTGFGPGTPSVTIGGQPATIEGMPSATQIGVHAPALAAGPQDVVVTSGTASAPMTLPYVLKFTITPDGDLSDWPAAALVGSETTASEWGSADTLTGLYMGYDDANLYIGIQGQAEMQNAIIGYLSIGGQTSGVSEITGVLNDHLDLMGNPDGLDDELSSGFSVNALGMLWQYGFGLFGNAAGVTNGVGMGKAGVRLLNTGDVNDLAWITATVAPANASAAMPGIEFAIPWQTTGTGTDLFVPFPSGTGTPMTVSAFIRLVSCGGSCFPNQSLPSDPNLQTGNAANQRSTVSKVATIEIR